MTRPIVHSGFPNAQEHFPDPARELGRHLGLYGEATIVDESVTMEGGSKVVSWVPRVAPVAARRDTVGRGAPTEEAGDKVVESSTHIISFYPDTDISTKNRVDMDGSTWVVTAKLEPTDELITRVEVKKL